MKDNEKLVYVVDDIQEILGIGRNQCYNLIKEERFPVIRVGRRIIIPKKGFMQWLEGESCSSSSISA